MLERLTPLRTLPLLAALGVSAASCSSSGTTTNGNGYYGGGTAPATLVSECDMICANVVAQCAGASNLLGTCLNACGNLNFLQASCLDPFLGYLTCVAGATRVTCGGDGVAVLVNSPQCESARQQTLTCNATPGLVTACIALPGSNACGGALGANPEFCVGAPERCTAPGANPVGIGIYCCP